MGVEIGVLAEWMRVELPEEILRENVASGEQIP